MAKIKYDADIMKYISLFESMTRAKLKDCIAGDKLTFIVEEGEIGKAIGKNGSNVKMLESVIKKRIRIIEFSNNVLDFIKNLVYPISVRDIKQENGIITIMPDSRSKGIIIGRDRSSINAIKSIVKRYFDIDDIKVS